MKTWLRILFGCLLCATGRAQPAPTVRHLHGQPLAANQLTARLAWVVDSAQVTGLSVLVLDRRRVAYEHYFGTKDRRTGEPLDPETVSYAASLTKPVSTYLFLRLVDQGIMALDTPVYRYLKRPIAAYEKWQDLAQDPAFQRITARCCSATARDYPSCASCTDPDWRPLPRPAPGFFTPTKASICSAS